MTRLVEVVATWVFVLGWLAGIVLAKGAWATTFAIFPLYAWYLVVERAMQHLGVL